MGILGSAVLGGEAYISFKPDLIDAEGNIAHESTRKFLSDYMERFAVFTSRLVSK
jgi:chromate reductase